MSYRSSGVCHAGHCPCVVADKTAMSCLCNNWTLSDFIQSQLDGAGVHTARTYEICAQLRHLDWQSDGSFQSILMAKRSKKILHVNVVGIWSDNTAR